MSRNINELILSFAFIYGLGHSYTYVLAITTSIKYSRELKDLITGFMTSAYSLGAFILTPITTFLIYNTGWRLTLKVYSLVSAMVLSLTTLVIKDYSNSELISYRFVKSRSFQLIVIIMVLTTVFDGLIAGNLIPLVNEPTNTGSYRASLALMSYTLAAIISRPLIGLISDYIGPMKPYSIYLYYIYIIATIKALLFTRYNNLLLICIGTSISSILFSTNVALSPIIAHYLLGIKDLEATYGSLLTAIIIGVLIGSVIGGLSRDLRVVMSMEYT